jgi:hypothetical protein
MRKPPSIAVFGEDCRVGRHRGLGAWVDFRPEIPSPELLAGQFLSVTDEHAQSVPKEKYSTLSCRFRGRGRPRQTVWESRSLPARIGFRFLGRKTESKRSMSGRKALHARSPSTSLRAGSRPAGESAGLRDDATVRTRGFGMTPLVSPSPVLGGLRGWVVVLD